jgi:hypothetical protein
MSNDRLGKALVTGALLAAAALPLPSRATSHAQRAPATEGGWRPAVAASLSQGDRRFIEEAARGGMAEVEMAGSRSSACQVRR